MTSTATRSSQCGWIQTSRASVQKKILVHCGNAPKMERVIDLTVALAARDVAAVLLHVRDDFVWSDASGEEILTYETLKNVLANRPEVKKLSVDNALSHGNGAMCEGVLEFADGDKLRYCMIVKFTSTAKDAVVKAAHTYFLSY